MGLITNLVQMKSQRDLQAKETAINGFKSILTNQNATPEMRQWAQQGILDVTVPAIAGDGKGPGGGGKKQHEGIRHILGSVLSNIGSLNPMASGPSKGVKNQIAQAGSRPRPAKMEMTQDDLDQIKQRQETAAAQIREEMAVRQAKAVEAAKSAQAQVDEKSKYEDRVKRADALFGKDDASRDRKEYILTGKLPNTPGFKNIPGLTVGSDPKVKAFAEENGIAIDPSKGYRVQQDSEGNVVSVMEAGSSPQQQRMYGAVQGYYFDGIAKGLSDEDAKKFAGRMFEQNQGIHLGRVEQQAAIDQALSGVGLGRGLNPDAAMKGLTPTPQQGKPPSAAAPARPAFTGIGRPATGQSTVQAQPKPALKPKAQLPDQFTSRAMDMYYSSILGNTPAPSGGPDKVGYIKGREAVQKLTGLSAQDFEAAALTAKDLAQSQKDNVERYVAMQRLQSAMDLMGPNVEQVAKKALQTGSPWLTKRFRDLKTASVGDPDIAALKVAVNDFQRQYAILTQGGALSRAQLPVATAEAVEKIIDPNQTLETIAATIGQIRQQAKLETAGFQNAIDKTSGEIKERLSGKKPAGDSGSSNGSGGGQSPTRTATGPNGEKLGLVNGKWVPIK